MAEPKEDANWFKEFQQLNKNEPPRPSAPKDSNRRKHSRFEVDGASASLYKEGFLSFMRMGSNRNACAVDLSEGGVRLLLHERVPPGTKVRIRIQMEKYKDEIVATGIVRWCFQSTKNQEEFYAGIMFTDLDASQLKKLALMKEWFTSPQFKAMRDGRAKGKRSDADFIFPK